MDLGAYLIQIRPEVHTLIATLITIFGLRRRKMMQHHLHHGEFVEIRIEQ
jgi:hypothetical protein